MIIPYLFQSFRCFFLLHIFIYISETHPSISHGRHIMLTQHLVYHGGYSRLTVGSVDGMAALSIFPALCNRAAVGSTGFGMPLFFFALPRPLSPFFMPFFFS